MSPHLKAKSGYNTNHIDSLITPVCAPMEDQKDTTVAWDMEKQIK